MSEWEFLRRSSRSADCGLLLDVNNVYVAARQSRLRPARPISTAMPRERVQQIHLAGHTTTAAYIIDTHDQPVIDPVWELYERGGSDASARSRR